MKTFQLMGKGMAMLPVAAGALLILTTVTHTVFASFVVPDIHSTTLWSMLAGMLPIPGSAVGIAPEIDPGSVGNALALLCGGMLLVGGLRLKHRISQFSEGPNGGVTAS